MKKFIAVLIAVAGITASFAGCSDTAENPALSQQSERISTAPLDAEIIGRWWNGTNGYIFDENGKVSLVMDFSAMNINFTDNGEFNKAGEIIDSENISYDGKNLIVYYTIDDDVSRIVYLERKDEENPDSFNGTYTMYGGLLTEFLIGEVGLSLENLKNDDSISISAVIDGESFVVTLENYCNYETIGNNIEMFSKYMTYTENNADCIRYGYSIENNTLTMTYTDGNSSYDEVYSRSEE